MSAGVPMKASLGSSNFKGTSLASAAAAAAKATGVVVAATAAMAGTMGADEVLGVEDAVRSVSHTNAIMISDATIKAKIDFLVFMTFFKLLTIPGVFAYLIDDAHNE
jgi:hypothetical protein